MIRIRYTISCFILLLSSFSFGQINILGTEEWATDDSLADSLPADLFPTFEAFTLTSGECFMYCMMKGKSYCTSLAFSQENSLCKLYFHPTPLKPLPKLKPDVELHHQMYYRKRYCPDGWFLDPQMQKCYWIDGITAVNRSAAWDRCETKYMSELVTFQSAQHRSNVYKVLNENYPNVSKWWSGYALFDGNMWPRGIDEFPGYKVYRGDCPGRDLFNDFIPSDKCALLCSTKYKDNCAGFVYNGSIGRCSLKYGMCDYSSNVEALTQNVWNYKKVVASRPPSYNYGDTAQSEIVRINDVSRHDCKIALRQYPSAVHAAYYANSRQCILRRRSAVVKAACANCQSWDKQELQQGSCPTGVRYRDTCLVFIRNTATFTAMNDWCRKMGGKLSLPIDGLTKEQYFYFQQKRFSYIWVDLTDLGHEGIWTSVTGTSNSTQYLTQPNLYQGWPWAPGTGTNTEPSNAANEHCGRTLTTVSNSTGNFVALGDAPCDTTTSYGMCEFPITQGFPRQCRFTPLGREYMGNLGKTISDTPCKSWSTTSYDYRLFPEWHKSHAFCRSPQTSIFQEPWCYNTNNVTEPCNVTMCEESDWAPPHQYVQSFEDEMRPYATITRTNLQQDGFFWTVEHLTALAHPLCQMNVGDWCPNLYRGSCYTVYKLSRTFEQAQALCSVNGGNLASISSTDEQNYLMGLTMTLAETYVAPEIGYWIGLNYDATTANAWVWANGDSSQTRFWQSGQPSNSAAGFCALLWTASDGYWRSESCGYNTWFICEQSLAA